MSRRSAGRGGEAAGAAKAKRKNPGQPGGISGRAVRRTAWGTLLAAVVGLLAYGLSSGGSHGGGSSSSGTNVGAPAPEGTFTTTTGVTRTISSLSGQPTLLWFVTTWCSSCAAGTQAMASFLPKLAALHVRVVEVENAGDLGQEGPSMTNFALNLAGHQADNPDWTFGVASEALTKTYNPEGDLDIYYLLNAKRKIEYINSSPASTMESLLHEAARIA